MLISLSRWCSLRSADTRNSRAITFSLSGNFFLCVALKKSLYFSSVSSSSGESLVTSGVPSSAEAEGSGSGGDFA